MSPEGKPLKVTKQKDGQEDQGLLLISPEDDSPNGTFTDEDAEMIFMVYPRRVGKKAALQKIHSALVILHKRGIEDPVEWLHDKTLEFATSPKGQAGQFCPHPSTWFNQGRYDDDPREWSRLDSYAKATPRSMDEQRRAIVARAEGRA